MSLDQKVVTPPERTEIAQNSGPINNSLLDFANEFDFSLVFRFLLGIIFLLFNRKKTVTRRWS